MSRIRKVDSRTLSGGKLCLLAMVLVILMNPALLFAETLTGTIAEVILDYPDGSSESELTLVDADGVPYKLDFSASPAAPRAAALRNGMIVEVQGDVRGSNTIAVGEVVIRSRMTPPPSNRMSGQRTSLTMLVNLSDASAETSSCTKSLIENRMYTTVNGTFERSSYGKLSFPGDSANVAGPFTIASPANPCNPYEWASLADAAATSAGYNLSNYQHRVYVLPQYNLLACGWAGLGNTSCYGFCRSWVALCTSPMVFAHELGHNLSLAHAGTDPEDDGTVNSTYGDHSCPMGNSSSVKHFNAPHKEQSGWLQAGQIVNFSADRSYQLYALHMDPATTAGPQAVKFARDGSSYYYVSFRENNSDSSQFNDGLNSTHNKKVSIHSYAGSGYQLTKFIKSLGAGESYTTGNGVTIEVTAINDTYASVSMRTPDSDGDGFSDSTETRYGSDPNDSSDYPSSLSTPVNLLWNSFLGMVNIVELVNPGDEVLDVVLRLYDLNGDLRDGRTYSIAANSQFDVILNSLNGFNPSGSYGLVTISVINGLLDGRTSYYRPAANLVDYEFAYSVPFANTMSGDRAVGFNTYEAGNNSGRQVLNWLTIANLSSLAQKFTINCYNQAGTLLASNSYTIAPNGRLDIDGGHGFAGPNQVGFHEIVPLNKSAPYIAQLVRYGSDIGMSQYFYAFPLSAEAGIPGERVLPISRYFGEANWVELINSSSAATTALVEAYNLAGTKISSQTLPLAARSQVNIDATALLAASEIGYLSIRPSAPGTLIAQSMFYHRNSPINIAAIYGTQALRPVGARLSGSFNLFLGAQNWLRVSNTSSAQRTLQVRVGAVQQSYVLAAGQSQMIAVHENAQWGTVPESYGFVSVTPDAPGVFSENLRLRKTSGGNTDFAFATMMRPQTN